MHQAALFFSYLTCGFIPGNLLRRKGKEAMYTALYISTIYIFYKNIG